MSNFKKAFFGGYKKEMVDFVVSELEDKLQKSEDEKKKLEREIEKSYITISDLEKAHKTISDLENKLSNMSFENEKLKDCKSENDFIFNNIAKIYERAYGAGREIVCDSKETAICLVSQMNVHFNEAMNSAKNVLYKYEAIQSDIDDMFADIKERLSSVTKNTSALVNNAKNFVEIYPQMSDILQSTTEDAERTLKKYEISASEFLNIGDFSQKLIPNNNKFKIVAEEIDNPVEDKVKANIFELKIPNKSLEQELFENTINKSVTKNVPQIDDILEAKQATMVDRNEINKNFSNNNLSPNNNFDSSDLPREDIHPNTGIRYDEINKISSNNNLSPNNNFASSDLPKEDIRPNTGSHSDEFTQFGRKSKVSIEERNELIRKALLKNGGS